MATNFLNSGFGGTGTGTTGTVDPNKPKDDPFKIDDNEMTNIFKNQAKQTASELMAGSTPGFDQQAAITREAQRTQQALAEKQKREAFLNAGMAGTGKFLQNELGTENQKERERVATERQLAVDKGNLEQQSKIAGLGAAQGIIGTEQAAATAAAGIASSEKMKGWDISQDQWRTARTEELTKAGWSHEDAAAEADRQWKTKMSEAERVFTTSERLSSQDFATGMAYTDAKIKEAQAANDFTRAKELQTMQDNLKLKMQMNDMDFTQKMKYLDAGIADAKANKDVMRQKTLMAYQADIDTKAKIAEFGQERAMKMLDAGIAADLAKGEFEHAQILQNQRIVAEAQEGDKNRAQADLDRELKKFGMTFEQLSSMVDNGMIDPNNLREWMGSKGINVTPPDPTAYAQQAKQKYNEMAATWGTTHPGMVVQNEDGSISITGEGQKAFNDYMNETLYNEKQGQTAATSLASKAPTDLIGADKPDNPNHADYVAALKGAKMWYPVTSIENTILGLGGVRKIKNPASIGQPITLRNKPNDLYIVDSAVQEEPGEFGQAKRQYQIVRNVATGETHKEYA